MNFEFSKEHTRSESCASETSLLVQEETERLLTFYFEQAQRSASVVTSQSVDARDQGHIRLAPQPRQRRRTRHRFRLQERHRHPAQSNSSKQIENRSDSRPFSIPGGRVMSNVPLFRSKQLMEAGFHPISTSLTLSPSLSEPAEV